MVEGIGDEVVITVLATAVFLPAAAYCCRQRVQEIQLSELDAVEAIRRNIARVRGSVSSGGGGGGGARGGDGDGDGYRSPRGMRRRELPRTASGPPACPICLQQPAQMPCETSCGHWFCGDCLVSPPP